MDVIGQITSLFEFRIAASVIFAVCAGVATVVSIRKYRSGMLGNRFIVVTVIAVLSAAGAMFTTVRLVMRLRDVPRILTATPTRIPLASHEPDIRVTFSEPVVLGTLAVYTNPPVDVTVLPRRALGIPLPWATSVIISPDTTLAPGTRLMVYLANVEGPLTRGYGGEHLLEYDTADAVLTSVSPPDGSTHVQVNTDIVATVSGSFRTDDDWRIVSDPPHSFTLTAHDNAFRFTPKSPLMQGTAYSLHIMHAPDIRSRKNGTVVRTLPERNFATIHLTTVKPAYISSFSASGSAVNPLAPIFISFDQAMDIPSVMSALHINPPISGQKLWDSDARTLTISHRGLTKNTEYSFTFKKGLRTQEQGILERDAVYTFRTAGPLTLSGSEPSDGATGIGVSSKIRLRFDQDIPESLGQRISIRPDTKGTFKKTGGTILEFSPDTPLSLYTSYTVTVASASSGLYGLPAPASQSVSFTTEKQNILLAVPYFKQQTPFTCNIAAARMLLAYRGKSVTEEDIIRIIGNGGKRGSGNPHTGYVDDFGTFWEAVARGVAPFGRAWIITNGSLPSLLIQIKAGNPVMTWGWNGWSDPHDISWTATDGTHIRAVNGMHSMVVRGFSGTPENPDEIHINDPWRGQYSLSAEEFMQRWRYYGVAMYVE